MKKNTASNLVSIGIFIVGIFTYLKRKVIIGTGAEKWSNDTDFFFLPSINKSLSTIAKSVGITLNRNKGYGKTVNMDSYKKVKSKSSVYWAVYDITNNTFLAQSSNATKNVYAASVSKVVVSASAFQNNDGILPTDSDYGKVIKLLVKSDNNVWDAVQSLAGGKDAVNRFSQSMGYSMSPARNGGNNINAVGMCKFWGDIINNKIKGSEAIYKITSSCQTSGGRSRVYIPSRCYIGSKTGTYTSYAHDCAWIQDGANFYSISVLTDKNNGSGDVALMFGGLFKEYIDKK